MCVKYRPSQLLVERHERKSTSDSEKNLNAWRATKARSAVVNTGQIARARGLDVAADLLEGGRPPG
jgi:hypothetical protein